MERAKLYQDRNQNVRTTIKSNNAPNKAQKDFVMFTVGEEPIVLIDNAQNVEIKEDNSEKVNLNKAPTPIEKDQVLITEDEPRVTNSIFKNGLIRSNTDDGKRKPSIDINNKLKKQQGEDLSGGIAFKDVDL